MVKNTLGGYGGNVQINCLNKETMVARFPAQMYSVYEIGMPLDNPGTMAEIPRERLTQLYSKDGLLTTFIQCCGCSSFTAAP